MGGIGPPFCFRVIPTYRVLSHSMIIYTHTLFFTNLSNNSSSDSLRFITHIRIFIINHKSLILIITIPIITVFLYVNRPLQIVILE